MTFALGYLAGILTLPALVVLYWLYALMCGQTRRYAASTVMYDHPVGDRSGTHTHVYSAWVPTLIRRWRVKHDAKHCVYTKLGETPGGVWDAAVFRHGHEVMGLDLEGLFEGDEAYVKAEKGMMLYRGITAPPPYIGGTRHMDVLAREQLARDRA